MRALDSWAGDWRAYRLRFFDHVVKGAPLDEPNVRIFVMGGGSGRRNAAGNLEHGGRWIAAEDWPPPGIGQSLRSICTAMAVWSRARLAAGAAPLSYDFDPSHPVPTIGGAMSSLDPMALGRRVRSDRRRPTSSAARRPICRSPHGRDVLVFQTPQLDAPVQVVGPIEAELWVATDGPDTDFTAKLIDVHPPSADYPKGYAMILTDGIMRLRYAEDPAQPRLRQAGEVVKIRITLFPTANLFLRGPSHPAGHFVEQFSQIRCQSEYRRAGGRGARKRDRGEYACSWMRTGRVACCCRCFRCEGHGMYRRGRTTHSHDGTRGKPPACACNLRLLRRSHNDNVNTRDAAGDLSTMKRLFAALVVALQMLCLAAYPRLACAATLPQVGQSVANGVELFGQRIPLPPGEWRVAAAVSAT